MFFHIQEAMSAPLECTLLASLPNVYVNQPYSLLISLTVIYSLSHYRLGSRGSSYHAYTFSYTFPFRMEGSLFNIHQVYII